MNVRSSTLDASPNLSQIGHDNAIDHSHGDTAQPTISNATKQAVEHGARPVAFCG
jgi:hypothetical protein